MAGNAGRRKQGLHRFVQAVLTINARVVSISCVVVAALVVALAIGWSQRAVAGECARCWRKHTKAACLKHSLRVGARGAKESGKELQDYKCNYCNYCQPPQRRTAASGHGRLKADGLTAGEEGQRPNARW